MANKKDDMTVSVTKVQKPLVKLNSLFNDAVDKLSTSGERQKEITQLVDAVDEILSNEIDDLSGITGDDISTFLVKVFNEIDNDSINGFTNINSIEDLFANNEGLVIDLFKERYKNKNYLLEDLSIIYSQLFELEEAVLATRDAIITSDDMSQSVSRTIKFKNATGTDESKTSHVPLIEAMEKEHKLNQKIKNHIIPKTLQYGSYYAYIVPYSKIFRDHMIKKSQEGQYETSVKESFNIIDMNDSDFFVNRNLGETQKTKYKNELYSCLENFTIIDENSSISSLLEGVDIDMLMASDDSFTKTASAAIKKSEKTPKNKVQFSEGTVDLNGKAMDFSDVKGCFIELIHPSKIIPVKILNKTIGYYYINDTEAFNGVKGSSFTSSFAVGANAVKEDDVKNSFITDLTNKIVKSFDKPYLEKNAKFKELLANSLMYNDLYKRKVRFQFIPKEFIVEFKVNEDEDGEGTSILMKSLFNAKLYLSLLIFKIISIITKSNDTKICYVKQGIDKNVSNTIQEVARSVKAKQINFTDLMNYKTMVSKVGKGKDIFIPIGKSGERGIEFDVMAGQDIQLSTEYMDMFRTGMINATGVPSVIMNYVNEADYAKTLVMANSKFLGRVVSYQIDFNSPITELYTKVAKYSTPIPEEIMKYFEYSLTPPKSLNNLNTADMLSNAEQIVTYMVKALTGDNATPSEDDNKVKDILFNKVSRELLPMLPWDTADKLLEQTKVELEENRFKKSDSDEA